MFVFLAACSSSSETQVDFICEPDCPPEPLIWERLNQIDKMFKKHTDENALDGATITWQKEQPAPGIYGLTYSNRKEVYIWHEYECDGEEKGLCSGVFDYEIGHLYMRYIMPGSTEGEWLEYRRKHKLL